MAKCFPALKKFWPISALLDTKRPNHRAKLQQHQHAANDLENGSKMFVQKVLHSRLEAFHGVIIPTASNGTFHLNLMDLHTGTRRRATRPRHALKMLSRYKRRQYVDGQDGLNTAHKQSVDGSCLSS